MIQQELQAQRLVGLFQTVQLNPLVVVDVGPLLLSHRKHRLLVEPPVVGRERERKIDIYRDRLTN
mgnify:CR=1 FL=1